MTEKVNGAAAKPDIKRKPRRSDSYRRRRPYRVDASTTSLPQGKWQVLDRDSEEVLGEFTESSAKETREGDSEITRTVYVINADVQLGGPVAQPRYDTQPNAADAIWKTAYKVKSKLWLLMRAIVLSMDWIMQLFHRLLLALVVFMVAMSVVPALEIKTGIADYLTGKINELAEQFRNKESKQ